MKCLSYSRYGCMLAIIFILGGCASAGNQTNGTRGAVQDPGKAAKLNLELGVAYMERSENAKALKKLLKAIKIDSQYTDAHNALGILYSRLGEDEKAGDHFAKAVRSSPNDSSALNNYGQFLCAHGQRQEGEKLFARAVENPLYQTPEFAYLNAGICAKDDQDLDQAEIQFRAALKKNPYMPQALFHMADLSQSLGRHLQARGYIERYGEAARHNARSLWMAVNIEKTLGDVDAEASYALRLKNNFPDSEETRLLLKSEGK